MTPSFRLTWWLAAGSAVATAALAFACGGSKSSPSPTTTTSTSVASTTTTAGSTTTTSVGPTTTTIPTLTASFTVASLSPAQRKTQNDPNPVTILPTGSPDACPLVNSSNPVLDCRFDAAASTGPITRYIWTYSFGTKQNTEETTTPQLKPTAAGCGFFAGVTVPTGVQFIQMKVDLQVRDASGAAAAVFSNQNVRIFPAGNCGYGF